MGVFPVRVVFTFDAFGLPFYRIHHFQRNWEQSPHLCILFTEIVFHVSHRFSSTVYIPSLDPKMYLSLSIFKDNVQRLDDRRQKQDSAFLVLIQSLLHPSGKEGSLFFPYVQVPIPNDLMPCQALAFSSVLSKQITVPLSPKSCRGYPSRLSSTSLNLHSYATLWKKRWSEDGSQVNSIQTLLPPKLPEFISLWARNLFFLFPHLSHNY